MGSLWPGTDRLHCRLITSEADSFDCRARGARQRFSGPRLMKQANDATLFLNARLTGASCISHLPCQIRFAKMDERGRKSFFWKDKNMRDGREYICVFSAASSIMWTHSRFRVSLHLLSKLIVFLFFILYFFADIMYSRFRNGFNRL